MTLILCREPAIYVRAVKHCPVCKRRRRFVGFHRPWHGITWTCCGCGDQWADGELVERPFKRGWRRENTARARATWPEAVKLLGPEHKQWMREHIPGYDPQPAQETDRAPAGVTN